VVKFHDLVAITARMGGFLFKQIVGSFLVDSHHTVHQGPLWQEDITPLKENAFINAAGRKMLNFFQPFHNYIDHVGCR
jgi:hypothetical protein